METPKQRSEWVKRRGELSCKGITPIWIPHGKFALMETILKFLADQIPEGLRRKKTQKTRVVPMLPRDRSSFVGRKKEVAKIKQLVIDNSLVTLIGPGGCGKTRLAKEVARKVLPQFPDGVWLTDLGPETDPTMVPQRVAARLGVPEQILAEHLSTKKALLILDTCEHLADACGALALEIVDQGKDIRIMATSRSRLKVSGEVVREVGPLEQADAVRLFSERASSYTQQFCLTEENAGTVAWICQRLDGMPLAVELVAGSWARLLSVEDIAKKLDNALPLPIKGPRDAPLRQQTLLATMEWSYELLTDDQKRLLRRLSVFRGGWNLQTASEICALDPSNEIDAAVWQELVDQSMVQVKELRLKADGADRRYHLLDTVRQLAARKLSKAEEELLRNRHRDWYLKFAEERASVLREGGEQHRVLEEIGREHDNLRGALDWCNEKSDRGLALRLGASLWRFWENRRKPCTCSIEPIR